MRRMEAVIRESADGLFTARADLAAAMLRQVTDDTYVRRPIGVVTTEVRPNILRLIWREAIHRK